MKEKNMAIGRSLISVSDKTGIIEFTEQLKKITGCEVISTGGTARYLKESDIEITYVSDYTGFKEILNGRVKTLHPKIHGGLLARRENKTHMQELVKNKYPTIDMVVCNLYPFEKTIAKQGCKFEDAIENIDIGGPTMLRSAAKTYQDVVVIVDPDDYDSVIKELKERCGDISIETRKKLMLKVFARTSAYDTAIHNYLEKLELNNELGNAHFGC